MESRVPPRGERGPAVLGEEAYQVNFPNCALNTADEELNLETAKNHKSRIIHEIAYTNKLSEHVYVVPNRKDIEIIFNQANKYYCLSQMELLKIKYIQYGIYFNKKKSQI
jgi:hypothetical protein